MKEVQYIIKDVSWGHKFYYKDKEMTTLHRVGGPAIEWANGREEWWFNGKCHRTDGPAITESDGFKAWYIKGKLHRTDGPAIESNGGKEWYIKGKLHRTDGPAIECSIRGNNWWLNGTKLTEKEFRTKTQQTININGKDFTVEELNALIEAAKGK